MFVSSSWRFCTYCSSYSSFINPEENYQPAPTRRRQFVISFRHKLYRQRVKLLDYLTFLKHDFGNGSIVTRWAAHTHKKERRKHFPSDRDKLKKGSHLNILLDSRADGAERFFLPRRSKTFHTKHSPEKEHCPMWMILPRRTIEIRFHVTNKRWANSSREFRMECHYIRG